MPRRKDDRDGYKVRMRDAKQKVIDKYNGVLNRQALNDAQTIAAHNFDIEVSSLEYSTSNTKSLGDETIEIHASDLLD